MADDACFVCFRSGRCDLNGAAKALAGLRLKVSQRGDELAVSYPGGPVLRGDRPRQPGGGRPATVRRPVRDPDRRPGCGVAGL